MLYRKLNEFEVSVLCFGSATFVAGRLNPNCNSETGILSLQRALNKGVNFIHSNSNLGTQWAIRKVIGKYLVNGKIHHIIKIETPLYEKEFNFELFFEEEIGKAMNNLNIDSISGVIHEIDIKKVKNKEHLKNPQIMLLTFYRIREIFNEFKTKGKVGILIGMAHDPIHMRLAIDSDCYDSFACYYSLCDLWVIPFLEELYRKSKSLIGIRPLRRGVLTDRVYESHKMDNELYRSLNHLREIRMWTSSLQCFAIRFAISHPSVASLVVGINQPSHAEELINAAQQPFSIKEFYNIVSELNSTKKE